MRHSHPPARLGRAVLLGGADPALAVRRAGRVRLFGQRRSGPAGLGVRLSRLLPEGRFQPVMFLVGCVVSCGALLVLAGLGKAYRGVRRMDGSAAIWRALRIPRRLVPHAELAIGAVECLTGAAVCARIYPVAAGAAMALLGAVFCALLGYVRANRVPGGCGCLGWRKRA